MRSFALALSVGFLALTSAADADTIEFSWSYSGPGVSASGDFETSTTATAGEYLITAISGQRNGVAITGLNTIFQGPDELLFYPATAVAGVALNPTQLDNNGFAYNVGATAYDVFTSVDRASVVESEGGPAVTFAASPVPEPNYAIPILFLFGLATVRCLRNRSSFA